MFVESDEYFDQLSKASPHFSEILRWGNIRQLLESRMATVCDSVDAGGELMYRFSQERLLAEVLSKTKRMSEKSLPPSMEEKFVAKALEAPVLGLKREGTMATATTHSSAPALKLESTESQSSTRSTETATSHTSEASTTATSVADEEAAAAASALKASIQASPEVTQLQRLRIAFSFICSSYIIPSLVTRLKQQLLEQKELVDFSPLDEYLAQVAKFRQEAASSRSMGDYSRKHVLDEEELMDRAEKKRKMEEDEKRKKAGESRGVKNLKKVNTTGMKKMSDFFKKKT
ncbi:ribonuclease h2 subunit b protein [Apiospora saccharicola]|uniref:Ribonuclease h2 subunit b protein n=1 Tax=Apiospora saccharicola TaxID=335842 RepID=A0ABR1U6D1_9PEZI